MKRAYDLNRQDLSNGALLSAAEHDGYQVVITVDGNISTQQNMSGREIAVVVLEAPRSSIGFLKLLVHELLEALPTLKPGELRVIRGSLEPE